MIFTIVIPIYNEAKNISLLVNEINEEISYENYEIVVVNDCSTDDSINELNNLKITNNHLQILSLSERKGQSYALAHGIKRSQSKTIVTMDGDGQNDPRDIMKLFKVYNSSEFKLVGGIRIKRKDNIIKRFSSRIANLIRSKIFQDNCLDSGCGLKIFEKKIFLSFPFFDGIHRFLPALFSGYNYKTFFIDVNHRRRLLGNTKYGTFKRTINGIRDIILVKKIILKHNNDQ